MSGSTLILKGGYYSSGPTLVDMGLIADGGGHSWTTGARATAGGQTGALRLRAQWNFIDGAQGPGSGVMLPMLTGGQLIYISNRSTSDITVWVAVNTNDTILGAGASETLSTGSAKTYVSVADGWIEWTAAGSSSSSDAYFGTNPGSLIDLITSQPASGIYQTAGASNIQAEPILGPFMGKDFTRAQSVSYLTTTLGSDVGEYAHLYNLKAQTGYPGAWQASHAYLLYDTVTNGGNLYSVTTAGTSAASGGPTGTGSTITDGSVVWMYRADNQAANGGKINLGVFTYADVNSGHAWGIANDLQISAGTNKVAAFAQEIDLNNYRMDYNTGLPGPSAVALQIFAGGPNRSSYAIGVAAQGTPSDPANFVYGLIMQGAKLVSDVDVWLSTGAATGLKVDGTRSATNSTAFYAADNSQNAIIIGGSHSNQDIWITDSAPSVLTVGGTHTNVVNITGTVSGVAWNGALSATSFVVSAAAGPTIRAGTGAATGTQPAGSLWLRTDGSAGARLYVSAGGGTWNAVAGV